ncbi:helix-turn-helix transcriptional regulator [Streptomyces palmae]|uniref:LuxR family transcriptional regulator n=1 Tax=Streptomyces palmae TaxID=1701085 RepID=A0A4Z0G2U3_9ACTN|nr:LuxR C-terminal-related transcriptional regulator [Streptomyces palmae]TGA90144.1 LuxR family transcriptional regulator [Streptomyces palmae]
MDGSSRQFAAPMPVTQQADTGCTVTLSAFAVWGGPPDIAAVLVVRCPPGTAPDTERKGPAGPRRPVLTRVDARILEGIAAGQSTLRLASRLHFSRQNIDYRVTGLMRRFEVPNRTALVSRAFSTGMLDAGIWPPKVIEDFVR